MNRLVSPDSTPGLICIIAFIMEILFIRYCNMSKPICRLVGRFDPPFTLSQTGIVTERALSIGGGTGVICLGRLDTISSYGGNEMGDHYIMGSLATVWPFRF